LKPRPCTRQASTLPLNYTSSPVVIFTMAFLAIWKFGNSLSDTGFIFSAVFWSGTHCSGKTKGWESSGSLAFRLGWTQASAFFLLF
jgi:hypothetical protein